MNPYGEQLDKHLTNFENFTTKFTNIFIPVVDAAIKMSTPEHVSAYSVYKSSKNWSGTEKKPKKNHKGPKKDKRNSKSWKSSKTANVSATSNKSPKTNKKTLRKPLTKYNIYSDESEDIETKRLEEKPFADDLNEFNVDDKKVPKYVRKHEGNCSIDSELAKERFDFESEDDEYITNERINNDYYNAVELLSSNEYEYESSKPVKPNCISKVSKKRKRSDAVPATEKRNSNTNNMAFFPEKNKTTDNFNQEKPRKSFSVVKNDKVTLEKNNRVQSTANSQYEDSQKWPTSSGSTTNLTTFMSCNSSLPSNGYEYNSIEKGKQYFQWLLNPVNVDNFYAKYWEQSACLIKGRDSNYFQHLISFKAIHKMLQNNNVEFTKNIDITFYQNGVRETLNPEGRALPPIVLEHYAQGCSIRLLNPQKFLHSIYKLCATLQEYFHCLVGANAYLTPPNSQGFAPHYDDIEAFVLQIEGRKRWKLYKPRNSSEILPRFSSMNFSQEEIGEPVLEQVLEPGDMLYFPRGTIHQACTENGYHSLHITLSVYQKQSFADLFEKMLPNMLKSAIASNVEMRKGLPLHAMRHAGLAFNHNSTKEREDLIEKVTELFHKCISDMPLQVFMDSAIDQMAMKFQEEALPPDLTEDEKRRTVFGNYTQWNSRGEYMPQDIIKECTNLRLIRANILRLVEEEGTMRIYYYLDNSKQYCEYESNYIEIDPTEAASVEVLINSYPSYIGVSELPLPTLEDQINLASALWERGLLITDNLK